MACQHCLDPDGYSCFPIYGVGPHVHVGVKYGDPQSWIGSTKHLPEAEWPENYREDEDCPGMGTYWCPYCGEGKPSNERANPAIAAGAKSGEPKAERT